MWVRGLQMVEGMSIIHSHSQSFSEHSCSIFSASDMKIINQSNVVNAECLISYSRTYMIHGQYTFLLN